MRIFITGGTGFIGRHVVKKLQDDGHEVALLKANLSEQDKLAAEVKVFHPDAVLHLAWEGIPDYAEEASAKNLAYGKNLLEAVGKTDCKIFLSTGSCWEYGRECGALREIDSANPKNPFAAAKVALCGYAKKWAEEKNIKFFWPRLFYVYGPGQKPASLIPHLITSFKNGIKPELKNPGGGNDFVYIDDVVEVIALILQKAAMLESGIFNVGSGKVTGVGEIVRLMGRYYGDESFGAMSVITGFYADISKIKKETGWSPKTSIEEGIEKTIKLYKI